MLMAAFFLAGDNNQEPARPLALARILVGSAMLLQLPKTYSHLTSLLVPGTFRVPYPISPSVGTACAPILVCLMVVLAVAAIVGWQTRIAFAGLAASLAFMLALDQQLYRSDLWLLFLECSLLSLAGSGAALSLDARRDGTQEFVEQWPVLLLKIQLSIVYAFSAMSKVNASFLRGDILQSALRVDDVPLKLAIALSLIAIATELFLAVALWFSVTRRPAMLVGFLLHTSFVVMLVSGPVLVAFELEMLALYMLFPGITPGECLIIYDARSRFILTFVSWCRRLDWLRACRFELCADHSENGLIGLKIMYKSRWFSGFEALREIAYVLPATCFLAQALTLPGIARLGARVYHLIITREHPPVASV
jgi:hypothetical protein